MTIQSPNSTQYGILLVDEGDDKHPVDLDIVMSLFKKQFSKSQPEAVALIGDFYKAGSVVIGRYPLDVAESKAMEVLDTLDELIDSREKQPEPLDLRLQPL